MTIRATTLFLSFFAIVIVSCSRVPAPPLYLDERNYGDTKEIHIGQLVIISLKGDELNPGLTWHEVRRDHPILEDVDDLLYGSNYIGTPNGLFPFRFKALKEGTTALHFLCENTNSPCPDNPQFDVTIVITKQKKATVLEQIRALCSWIDSLRLRCFSK